MVENTSAYYQDKINDIKGYRITDVGALRHWIVSQYAKKYSAQIDDTWIEKSRLSSERNDWQLPNSESPETSLETLVLGENCMEHCGDNRFPVYIIERWCFRLIPRMLNSVKSRLVQEVQREIHEYFNSSRLLLWFSNNGRAKRYKVTHRYLDLQQAVRHLGYSFLMNATELVDTEKSGRSFDFEDGGGEGDNHSSADEASNVTAFDPALITHTFSLIDFGTQVLLEVCVSTPRQMPSQLPYCPLCTTPRSSDNRNVYPRHSSSDSSNDLSPRRVSPNEVPSPSNSYGELLLKNDNCLPARPSILNWSGKYSELAELCSPMVLTTTAQHNLFPITLHSPCYDLLSLKTNFGLAESATSTLTKKSRSVIGQVEPNQASFESPPRKQQCFLDSHVTNYDDSCKPSPLTTRNAQNTGRAGCIENFIAQFNLLNVERELRANTMSSSSPCTPRPDDGHKSSISSEILRLGSKRKEQDSRTINSDVEFDTVGTRSSNIGGEHLSRGRRRNANSTSVFSLTRDSVPCFNRRTGLPLQSSPVPLKRSVSGRFDFDCSLGSPEIYSSIDCSVSAQTQLKPTEHPSGGLTNSMRRRPTSLRLSSTAICKLQDSSDSTRLSVLARRRTCTTASAANTPLDDTRYVNGVLMKPSSEAVSCSAPPSGSRAPHSSSVSSAWLPCTPVWHGSSQHLLVNFEESMLNGRIHPVGQVDGFTLELGASGSFFPAHQRLPMQAYFFNLSEDNKPSPYLGYADLQHLLKGKGYHLPKKGSVQLTLFNPNKFVVKMFVIGYDFEDMPPDSQTFLRQRTVYVQITDDNCRPGSSNTVSFATGSISEIHASEVVNHHQTGVEDTKLVLPPQPLTTQPGLDQIAADGTQSCAPSSSSSLLSLCSSTSLSSACSSLPCCQSFSSPVRGENPAYLRYLVQLRFHTTRSGRLYLHTDVKLIFARDKFEFDPRVATYELRSFVDIPSNPRYSPKKWTKRGPRSSTTTMPRVFATK